MYMRWKFITKYTNICYKHHNIYITVSKPAIIIATVDKKNDNNNEGDIIKIAILSDCPVGQHWGHLVSRKGCHK